MGGSIDRLLKKTDPGKVRITAERTGAEIIELSRTRSISWLSSPEGLAQRIQGFEFTSGILEAPEHPAIGGLAVSHCRTGMGGGTVGLTTEGDGSIHLNRGFERLFSVDNLQLERG